jgi:DNA replication and repair protein RecF
MILSGIRLSNFRNHAATEIAFGPGLNALFGDNGQGKTSLLEAVSYLSLTKSFYAASDSDAVRIGADGFELEGTMVSATGVTHRIRVAYVATPPGKTFTVDALPPESLASVIGRFPAVVLSPENSAITFGGPAERRKFVDLTLAQVSGAYLRDLMEYRRILRQRNRILVDGRMRGSRNEHALAPWTESLIAYGARVAHRRRVFIDEFAGYVERAYVELNLMAEKPGLAYHSGCSAEGAGDAEETGRAFAAALERARGEEMRRGTTLAGPHRDDLRLTLDGLSVQQFASQGQHKTLLVALKFAEFAYVKERRDETPLLLLDDVFSELDERRAGRILALAAEMGQSLITTTDDRTFGTSVAWGGTNRRFTVERGTCRETS